MRSITLPQCPALLRKNGQEAGKGLFVKRGTSPLEHWDEQRQRIATLHLQSFSPFDQNGEPLPIQEIAEHMLNRTRANRSH